MHLEKERDLRVRKSERALWELSIWLIRKSNIKSMGMAEGKEMEKGRESLGKQIVDENRKS